MKMIEVAHLCKEYRIPHEKRNTAFEALVGLLDTKRGYEEFTALKDINFSVEKGKWLGVIGPNGSGKSTLLKIIANTLRPTKGRVTVNGRLTSFLELGVGFQPDLTAIENIRVYGAIMGFSDDAIEERVAEILDFAGLKHFVDTKLKNFSSGMIVRLAFSTAIQTEPEILLLDEVLAVGDMEFQQKCFDVFERYRQEDKTVVFVTHDMGSIKRFCDRALLLNHGEQVAFGDTEGVIDVYVGKQNEEIKTNNLDSEEPWRRDLELQKEKIAKIVNVNFLDITGRISDRFRSWDQMTIEIIYNSKKEIKEPLIGIAIFDEQGNHLYGTSNYTNPFSIKKKIGEVTILLHLKHLPFSNGRYFLQVAIAEKVPERIYKYLDFRDKIYSFTIVNATTDVGPCYIEYDWDEKRSVIKN
jgi:lipopolysaccharide transport system ATP-binding protein